MPPVLPLLADLQPPRSIAPPTQREREEQWLLSAVGITDLGDLPMAELRVLANRMFRLLDAGDPPFEAAERYAAAVAELESRARSGQAHGPARQSGHPSADRHRQVFKDSTISRRFELFLDQNPQYRTLARMAP